MTREQSLLLCCMRSELTGAQLNMEAFAGCDWDALLLEARQQSVLLHTANILALKEQVPEHIRKQCQKLAFSITSRNLKTEYHQKQLVQLLEEHSIDYLILKGEAANAYYPVAGTRQMGDVDFLVKKEDLEKTAGLLLEQGFERTEENHHHQVFKKGSANLEMHSRLAGAPEGKLGLVTEQFVNRCFDRGEKKPFHAPAPELHGAILLLHMQHHMLGEGLGLRHLADWGCFVSKTCQMAFWKDQLLPFLEQIGLRVYAEAMTAAASFCFETPCPDWVNTERILAEQVAEDLFKSGNFGGKDRNRAISGKMIGTRGNRVLDLYDTLRRTVLEQQPHLENKKLQLGAQMVKKGALYLYKTATGKRPKLTDSANDAARRMKLYDKLQVFKK